MLTDYVDDVLHSSNFYFHSVGLGLAKSTISKCFVYTLLFLVPPVLDDTIQETITNNSVQSFSPYRLPRMQQRTKTNVNIGATLKGAACTN